MAVFVSDFLDAIDRIAPARWAFPGDKIGLQVGDHKTPVTGCAVALDWSRELIEYAASTAANLLVVHHPLIWDPLKTVTPSSRTGQIALELIAQKLVFVAAHTNWDAAPGGINDALAERIGLIDVEPFGWGADVERLKLTVFCPKDVTQRVLDALAECGAGAIGNYSRCAFWSEGTGTFIGNESTHPSAGSAGKIERVAEDRLEVIVYAERVQQTLNALRAAHPYEEPAIDLYRLAPEREMPMGRIGILPNPMTLGDFVRKVDAQLSTRSLAWGDPNKTIKRVGLVGGAADGDWHAAMQAGADAYITGEVKQNTAVDASQAGIAILSSGHYATEQPGVHALAVRLQEEITGTSIAVFEPEAGVGGRPR